METIRLTSSLISPLHVFFATCLTTHTLHHPPFPFYSHLFPLIKPLHQHKLTPLRPSLSRLEKHSPGPRVPFPKLMRLFYCFMRGAKRGFFSIRSSVHPWVHFWLSSPILLLPVHIMTDTFEDQGRTFCHAAVRESSGCNRRQQARQMTDTIGRRDRFTKKTRFHSMCKVRAWHLCRLQWYINIIMKTLWLSIIFCLIHCNSFHMFTVWPHTDLKK